MLKDGNFKRVIICCSMVDLRKGIDGLASYVKLNYGLDTLERGTVFLFCGTRNDRICISSSVFPKNRKEKFPILGIGYSHISAGNIFI
ncbi:IS66 family insertion sequence element accessory protein TnpB [Bariatricus sp. HCP28S3_E4]|uniref:IS66 family insertion sequence element accessory protein TnpB n=1 Tax=unclassified Bariatricus TaxID=2677046 RepID=UPI003F8C122A